MTRPQKQLTIDLGRCPNWTLQKADASSTTFIRCLGDDAVAEIQAAVAFCRKHVSNPSYRLLYSSYRVWQQILAKANSRTARGPELFSISNELLGALVGWLLIWRLIIDQADHDLSQRFGKNSEELARVRQAKKEAYDAHEGYRLVEAIRNLVQHREMPPLSLSHSTALDPQSGRAIIKASLTIPVSWLLNSMKCPATIKQEFSTASDSLLQVPDVMSDAMAGIQKALETLVMVDVPQLADHINYLRCIFLEAHPAIPVLMRAQGDPNRGVQVEMQRLDDLFMLVRDAPVGNPYHPAW